MCGIAGFSGRFDRTLLKQMGALIAHRGPDDVGDVYLLRNEAHVGLIHRRLAIIDLSISGHQPMTLQCEYCQHGKDKHIWLVYNGELFNYQALRSELEAKGHHFSNQTDSEVLLHLYVESGPAMLKRLNGIFAFAIYDGRNTGQSNTFMPCDLFLARDGFGIKPLYYAQIADGFLFASEIKALLACKKIKRHLDPLAIHYYLSYLWCPGQQTALSAIKKVEPGEAMIIHAGKIVKRWYYYDLPYQGDYTSQSESDISLELNRLLTQAVEKQMVADVKVGAFLSGGLDSSAIVALMRKLKTQDTINCYSIAFGEGMASEGAQDDLPFAKKVAKHLNVKHTILSVNADIVQYLPHMIYHLDEPQADPAAIHVFLIAARAREDGVKVLLSGAGGDDIFSGYRRHQALYAERIWQHMPISIKRKMAAFACHLQTKGPMMKLMQYPLVRRLAKLLAVIDLPLDRRLVNYFMWNTEGLRRSLYHADMAFEIEKHDTALPLLNTLQRIPLEKESLNRMLYLEAKHFLADHNLNYTDKMSMAAGVEVRVPLLDTDLVNFATRIPAQFKQSGKSSKAIFKKTMYAYLPKAVINRPKTGFGVPLRRFLHHQWQPLVNDLLTDEAIKRRNIFDAKAISKLMQLDKQGRIDASYTIFSLLCIELWCKTFIDCVVPQSALVL